MIVGYARVSAEDQDLTVQLGQLTEAGCTKIFSEKKSGTKVDDRTQLKACLAYVREGDLLVFTRIDRLARSVRDFANILSALDEKSVGMRCLLQPFDTTTPQGRLMRDMLAAFAEFETAVRRERQMEGIRLAKELGVYNRKISGKFTMAQVASASRRLRKGQSYAEVAAATGISDDFLRKRFPEYNKKAYSRSGSATKVPYRDDLPEEPAPEPVVESDTPETVEKKMRFLDRFLGGAKG